MEEVFKYKMQVACNPQDVKTYVTDRLRSSFLMEKEKVPDEINVTHSMYDRLIFGGALQATTCLSETWRMRYLTMETWIRLKHTEMR